MTLQPAPRSCPICNQPSDSLSPDGYCLRHEAEFRGEASDRATIHHQVSAAPRVTTQRARVAWSSTDRAEYQPATYDDGTPRRPSRSWRGLRDLKPIKVSCWDRHGSAGLCPACLSDFSLVLSDVPYLLDDLDVAIAGTVEFVQRGQRRDAEPAPADDAIPGGGGNPAVRAHQRLVAALELAGDWFDVHPPELLALHLFRALDQLVDQPELRKVAREITAAAARTHHVIDAPADLWFYGPCPECGNDLLQERIHRDDHDALIRCRRCDYAETADRHQKRQLDARADAWLTETELVSAFTAGGQPLTRDRLKNLIAREEIPLPRERRSRPRWVHGHVQSNEVWTYRVADVRDVVDRAEARRSRAG